MADAAAPLRAAVRAWRLTAPALRPTGAAHRTALYVQARRRRRHYRTLAEAEARAARRSDTAFVLGSGKSVLELSEHEWGRVAAFDTISFSQFPRQRFVRADFHVVGEVNDVDEYAATIRANPHYAETIFALQEGWLAERSNELLARRLLPDGARVVRYRRVSRAAYAPPSRSLGRGLVHGWNSSISVANFAIALGWKRIVLAGVDLYDREYFWLPLGVRRPDEETYLDVTSSFPNAHHVVDLFRRWRGLLEPEGVELAVLNPRSLLAEALPVFDRAELAV